MSTLNNTQYTAFIMDHVVRPYQSMLGINHHLQRVVVGRAHNEREFNYASLIIESGTNPEWFECVINRLSKSYTEIDFSFFPNEAFAQTLMKALINKGVTPLVVFNDVIYANVSI